MINKYNKVLHLGDPLLVELFTGNWHIEEKVDGSQFRILVNDGKVFTGSKRVSFIDREPDKMFFKAREMAEKHFKDLLGNFVIFCEYLQKCKHNTLIYDRTPKDNIVIFDVLDLKDNKWMTYEEKGLLADAVG